MAMSKSDFVAIAAAVADTKANHDPEDAAAHEALATAARYLAAACARQYRGGYGFNRSRFLTACGYPQD